MLAGRMSRPAKRPASNDSSAIEHRRAALDAIVAGGRLTFPEHLPITARRDELLATIRDHQVVVVAGETGSGKSTQLPKLCLALGRGVDGIIGHTQPRRVAARTIAARVAEELGTTVGREVGFSVRFDDRVDDGTLLRVMTDGIVLAELQRDRELRRYDTLIIDEAHERSLNIDLLLGYVQQLLPRRPDLKVIITSATIDTERFAAHFATRGVPAPVIEITGRTFPVEVRYRPIGEDADDDRDQVQAVCDAVAELSREGTGDVLVFLSGEREIHDTAAAVRALELPATDVLPLYARLSWAEQQRIFQPHPGRRVVLSTNVAETSITVPGVRFVVDAGTARISRYSRRLKVQRLPIERVSQASADQRAGRCGRVAPGICIRLYSEDDYESRPEFSQPEILRTNLAAVILQMTSLGLGDVARFPFVDAPDAASVRDGYVVLEELAAIDAADDDASVRRLTPIGRRLARLPVDPRLGRMVLEADRLGCVREVLVIAAALSIQDPRERPEEHRQQADELHRRFDVAGSDLLSIVALWDHVREQQRQLSSNQFRRLCRAEFLNYLRVREWQDLYSQLRQVAGGLGIRPGTEHGHPDHVHRAVMAGLLSHLGMRVRDSREFAGARGSRFMIGRGSQLARRPPRWVMAAELVETDRVWARRVAAVQPEWAERLGAHLVKRTFGDPWWDADRGSASIAETVTLYGLPIVHDRTVALDRVDPAAARTMFVRHALVDGEWRSRHAFVLRNREFVDRWHELSARARRSDVIDEGAILDFYDDRVPREVVSARHFDRWWTDVSREQPNLLDLTDDVLGRDSGLRWSDYPDEWQVGDVTLRLGYRYAPGEPLDGVTAYVPVTALNQLDQAGVDWHVPGWRSEAVAGLVRTLPKEARRHLIPAAETVAAASARLGTRTHRPMTDELAAVLGDLSGVHVDPRWFRPDLLATHLRAHVVVVDDGGVVLDAGDDLDAIRARLASVARAAIARAVPLDERRGIKEWDVGVVPRVVEAPADGHVVRGYPALLDDDDSVSLRVLTNGDLQERVMRGGVRRLLLLTAAPSRSSVIGSLDRSRRLVLAGQQDTVEADSLAGDCIVAAVDELLDDHGELPWDEQAFEELRDAVLTRAPALAASALASAVDVLAAASRVRELLITFRAPSVHASLDDATDVLERLVRPRFAVHAGVRHLPDVVRYVEALAYRLERLAGDVDRDRRRMADVLPLEERHAELVRAQRGRAPSRELADIGWQLEELRVATFAQQIGARGQVSATRIRRALDAVEQAR